MRIYKTKNIVYLAMVGVLLMPTLAQADRFDDQINELNKQIEADQSVVSQKQSEADTLKNKLAIIDSQITVAQAELDKTRIEATQTQTAIDRNNADLERQKEILGENLRTIYKQGEVSPIELMASSKNLSDFVAQREYLDAIKDKVDQNLDKINKLKRELEEKKNKLAILENEQKAQVKNIAAQQAAQQNLLAVTQGEESRYQAKIGEDKKKIAELRSQQAAAIAAASGNLSYGGSGGYPWAGMPKDGGVDPWGYYWRECTSYAAWKRAAIGRPLPPWGLWGWADAKTWVSWAQTSGIPTSSSPSVGDVGVYQGGYYGHVMIVERVEGSNVWVSQYNAEMQGLYSESSWPISSLTFIK